MTSSLSPKSLVIETRNSFSLSLNFVSSFVIVIVWLSFFRRYLDLFCLFLSHFRLCIFIISLLHSVPQLKSLYSCRKIKRKKLWKGHDSHYNRIHHGYFLISIFLSLTSFLDFSSAHFFVSSSLVQCLWLEEERQSRLQTTKTIPKKKQQEDKSLMQEKDSRKRKAKQVMQTEKDMRRRNKKFMDGDHHHRLHHHWYS